MHAGAIPRAIGTILASPPASASAPRTPAPPLVPALTDERPPWPALSALFFRASWLYARVPAAAASAVTTHADACCVCCGKVNTEAPAYM